MNRNASGPSRPLYKRHQLLKSSVDSPRLCHFTSGRKFRVCTAHKRSKVIDCAENKEGVGESPWRGYPRHCCAFQDLISNSRWPCLGSVRLWPREYFLALASSAHSTFNANLKDAKLFPSLEPSLGKSTCFAINPPGKLSPFSFFAFVESILSLHTG